MYIYNMYVYIYMVVYNSCTSIYYLKFFKKYDLCDRNLTSLCSITEQLWSSIPPCGNVLLRLCRGFLVGWEADVSAVFNKKSNLYMYMNIEISTGKKWKQHLIPEKHMWIQHHSEDVPAISSWFSGKTFTFLHKNEQIIISMLVGGGYPQHIHVISLSSTHPPEASHFNGSISIPLTISKPFDSTSTRSINTIKHTMIWIYIYI